MAAIPLGIGIALVGGAPLAGFLAIASALASREFFRIAEGGGYRPFSAIGVGISALTPLAVYASYLGLWQPTLALPFGLVLGIMALMLWRRGIDAQPLASAAVTVIGVLYTAGMLSFGYAIRYNAYAYADATMPWSAGGSGPVIASGGLLVLLPLLATWASDTGAFAIGRRYGRRKLMPSVSPGKTMAGATGGLVATVVVVWVYTRFLMQPATQLGFKWAPAGILLFGAAISIAAQLGDLVESLLKREAAVKNSSNLIPGHGGVLDRLDSLFFVLPVAYFLLDHLLIWAPTP